MAEDNPIEGLDPNQSAFEPMLDMMDQETPEDLSRTTTTTTLYISGDQTQIDQPRVSTTTTMAPVETLDIVSQFRQSNPEVKVGDVNKVIPNASYEERMQLLFDYPDQFGADIAYNNKINSYVTQLKDKGYKDDQILSYLEQEGEGTKGGLMVRFPDLFNVKSIKRKDNVLQALESDKISYSRLLKFGSESKLKNEYPEFANLIDQKKKNEKIQKEIKAQQKKEDDELQREIEDLKKAIETGKGLFDQDLSFTQIEGFRKRLREIKGEQTMADLDANDPFRFQGDTSNANRGKISYKRKPVTGFEFERINEFNLEPIVRDYRFVDQKQLDQELELLNQLNTNIRATGGKSLSDEQIREVYVDGTKPFNENYKEYDDQLWNTVSGIVSTQPVVDLNDEFFERHDTTRDEFINKRKLILSSGLFNTQKLGDTYYTEEEFQAMYNRASKKLINEYGSTIGTYEKITGTNLRENPEQFYDEARKSSSLYMSDIDEDIVIGDSEQTSKNLRKRFGFLPYGSKDEAQNYLETEGFRFSFDGDNLVIQSTITPEGKSTPELLNGIEVNMNGSDVSAKIKNFMSKGIATDDIQYVMNEYKRGEGRFQAKFDNPMRASIDLTNYILSKPHVFGDANGFATDGYGQGFLFGLIPMGGGKDKSKFMRNMSVINTLINALEGKDPISNQHLINNLNKNIQYAQYVEDQKAPELTSLGLAAAAGLTETLSGITEGVVDLIIDIPFAPASNTMSEDEVNMLKESGLEEYQILDIQNKRIKDEVEYGIDEWINNTTAVTDKSIADAGLTYEVIKTMIHSISTGAIVGFNPSLVPVAFGLQTTARVENELKDSDLSNFEKRIISWPMATFEGILENFGLQTALSPGKSMLFKWVASRALKNLPKDASLNAIEASMKYTMKGLGARTMLGILEGGSFEALTEVGQEAVEFTEKNIVNMLLDKGVFKNMPDITTEPGAKQFLNQLGKAALLGGLSGGGISTISGTTNLLVNGFQLKGLNKSFENQYNVITSEEGRAIALSQINLAYQSKQITKEEANARIKAMNDAYPLMMEIPAELSSGQKRQAYDLMLERKALEAEVKDKDKNLVVKQTERIAEINNELQQISKTDAIQESETKEEVLPDEQSEMGLQDVGQGDTQGEEASKVQQELDLQEVTISRKKTEEYVKELEDIKQSNPEQYWSVDSVSLEDAKQGTVVSVEGGKGIVGPDGDIKGVFKSKDSKAEKVADNILEEAVNNGGTKLDNFDNYLTRIYERNGFRVASRTPFSEEFAPDGWNKEKHGTPDVVAMVYDPESKLDIEEKTFDNPETGYDEMIAYRDSFIEAPVAEQVTEEVVEDITPEVAENIKNIEKQADNARKAISKVLPGVEIITHSTEDSYRNATDETDSKKQATRGEYNPNTKTIHINQSKANNRTVGHEVFHAVLFEKVKTDKAAKGITDRMIKSLSKNLEGMPEVKEALDAFAANYDENIQSEEKLAELVGILAGNYAQMNKPSQNLIKRFLDRLAKMFGLKTFTDGEVVDLLNTIAGKVAVGEEISDIDLKVIPQSVVDEKMSDTARKQAEDLFLSKDKPKLKSTKDVAEWLDSWSKENKVFDKDVKDLSDSEIVDKFADHITLELTAWEKVRKDDYVSFYDKDIVEKTNPILQEYAKKEYGRPLTNTEVKLYHLVSAFASPSANPEMDSWKGFDIFDRFMKTGELSGYSDKIATEWKTLPGGKRVDTGKPRLDKEGKPMRSKVTPAYSQTGLDKFNTLIDKMGGDIDMAMDWITSEHSYKEVADIFGLPEKGPKALKQNEYMSKENGGFGVFGMTGAKLGSYILNRFQNFSTVTKDMWYARTMARLAGQDLVAENKKTKKKGAIKIPWAESTVQGRRMRRLADKAFQEVAKTFDTSPAMIQERIWDFEKRMYEMLGANEDAAYTSDGLKKGIERAKESPAKRKQIVIGENANLKQNVKDFLLQANEMESKGKSREEIRLLTGWERGADKKWRYELNDVIDIDVKNIETNKLYNIEDVISFPGLFDAYSDAKKLKVKFINNKYDSSTASYNTKKGLIEVNLAKVGLSEYIEGMMAQSRLSQDKKILRAAVSEAKLINKQEQLEGQNVKRNSDRWIKETESVYPSSQRIIDNRLIKEYINKNNIRYNEYFKDVRSIQDLINKGKDIETAKGLDELNSSALHEIQHAASDLAGFPRGGNAQDIIKTFNSKEKNEYNDIVKDINTTNKLLKEGKATLEQLNDLTNKEAEYRFKKYEELAGEVEARNVQRRRKLSPEQRRNMTLKSTQSVAAEDQKLLYREEKDIGIKEKPPKQKEVKKKEKKGLLGIFRKRKQLVAPNGKPSNLNQEQYDLVRTPAFKNWFGDWQNDPKNASKVVDENGEPMVVYHGSAAPDIEVFERGKSVRRSSGLKEMGVYFSTNPELAKIYSEIPRSKDYNIKIKEEIQRLRDQQSNVRNNRDYEAINKKIELLEKGRVYPVFLNIRDMLTFDAKFDSDIEAWDNLKVKASYKTAKGRDAMEFLSPKISEERGLARFGVKPVDGIKAENTVEASYSYRKNGIYVTPQITEKVKNTQDYKDFVKKYGGDAFLLFDGQPQNIKLADGSNKTFDPQEPSIRKQKDDGTVEPRIDIRDLKKKSDKKIKETNKGKGPILRRLRRSLFDRQNDIKRVIKDFVPNPKKVSKIINRIVTKAGASGYANELFTQQDKKIFGKLKADQIENLELIIYARRIVAINENRRERGMNPYKGMDGLDEQAALQNLEKFEQDLGKKEFDALSKRADQYFEAFKNNLKMLRDSGRITEETYENLKDVEYSPIKTLKYIIPQDTMTDEDINNAVSTLGVNKKDIMKLSDMNENEILFDARFLLMMNTNIVVRRSFENEMLNEFAQGYESIDKAGKEALSDFIIEGPVKKVPPGFRKVEYFQDGVKKEMVMKEDYARQLLDIKNQNNFLKGLGKISGANILRFFATGGNPLFIIGNTAVDFANIAFFSDVYSSIKPLATVQLAYDFVKNFLRKSGSTNNYNKIKMEFMEHGGAMDFLSTDGLRMVQDMKLKNRILNKAQKGLAAYARFMSYVGETGEMSFRLAVYERVKKAEIKKFEKENDRPPNQQEMEDIMFEAAAQSRETIDFSQGGTWVKQMDQALPYFNAAMQGLRRPLDFARKNPVGFTSNVVQYAVMAAGMTATSLGTLLRAIGDDEEEKKKVQDTLDSVSMYEKANYHIIFTGNKDKDGNYQYVRIKKLPLLSILGTATEQYTTKYLLKSQGIDYKTDDKAIKKSIEMSAPLDVLGPVMGDESVGQALGGIVKRNPLAAAWLTYTYNEDTFTGDKVFYEPKDKKIKPYAEGLYDDRVNDIYKVVAPALDMSPKRAQAAVEKIVTSESTNPSISIFYALTNGLFDTEADVFKENSDTFNNGMGHFLDVVSKKMVRHTNPNLLRYKNQDRLEDLEKSIDTDAYLTDKKIKKEIDKSINFKNFRGEGDEYYKEQEKMDELFKKYDIDTLDRNSYVSYTELRDLKGNQLFKEMSSILYEKNPKMMAARLYEMYGNDFDIEAEETLLNTFKVSKRNSKVLLRGEKFYNKYYLNKSQEEIDKFEKTFGKIR